MQLPWVRPMCQTPRELPKAPVCGGGGREGAGERTPNSARLSQERGNWWHGASCSQGSQVDDFLSSSLKSRGRNLLYLLVRKAPGLFLVASSLSSIVERDGTLLSRYPQILHWERKDALASAAASPCSGTECQVQV